MRLGSGRAETLASGELEDVRERRRHSPDIVRHCGMAFAGGLQVDDNRANIVLDINGNWSVI